MSLRAQRLGRPSICKDNNAFANCKNTISERDRVADGCFMTRSVQALESSKSLRVHALLLGERLNASDLHRDGALSTTPLSYRSQSGGLVAVFRFGAVVLIGLTQEEERQTLEELAERTTNRAEQPEEEVASVILQPDHDEQITATGAID